MLRQARVIRPNEVGLQMGFAFDIDSILKTVKGYSELKVNCCHLTPACIRLAVAMNEMNKLRLSYLCLVS